MMAALLLEYINGHGDSVERWLPVFKTMAECQWWADWFTQMLKSDHATDIMAVCLAVKP
jgi:hypothetical protein